MSAYKRQFGERYVQGGENAKQSQVLRWKISVLIYLLLESNTITGINPEITGIVLNQTLMFKSKLPETPVIAFAWKKKIKAFF